MLGDTVQFPLTLQRLDKDRLIAGYDFIREAVVRTLGATMGRGWGSASYIQYDTSEFTGVETSGSIGIGYAVLVTSTHAGYGAAPAGKAILYDPERASQAGNTSVAVTTDTKWIQFRRLEDDGADVGDQVQWVAGVPIVNPSTPKAVREYVEFRQTTALAPNASVSDGWFPLARVTWAGNIPTVETLHFLDGPTAKYTGGIEFGHLAGAGDSVDNLLSGILPALRLLFAQVYQIIDSEYAFDVFGNTDAVGTEAIALPQDVPYGLRQLATSIGEASKWKNMRNLTSGLDTAVRTTALLRVSTTGDYGGLLWVDPHVDYDSVQGVSIATESDLDTFGAGLKAQMTATGCCAIRLSHPTTPPVVDHVLLQGIDDGVYPWSYIGQIKFEAGELGIGTDAETWFAIRTQSLNSTDVNGMAFVEVKALSNWWAV